MIIVKFGRPSDGYLFAKYNTMLHKGSMRNVT